MSLNEQATELELQRKGKVAPRLTPAHIDAAIVGKQAHLLPGTVVTVVLLTLYNGVVVTGVNHGPADPANFDAEIGERLALEAARDRVWELEGYLLADRIHRGKGGAPVPAYGESIADRLAAEKLVSLGYGFDIGKLAWLRGDEDLVPGPAPEIETIRVTDGEGNSATHEIAQPTIVDADALGYGAAASAMAADLRGPVPVTAEGEVIEQIDGSADIVREPVAADGYSTSEGANAHGLGPDTDGGSNPDFVGDALASTGTVTPLTDEQVAAFADAGQPADPEAPHGRHPDGAPITVVTDEQQAAIAAADAAAEVDDPGKPDDAGTAEPRA